MSDVETTLIRLSGPRSQADVNRAWEAVENTLMGILRYLDRIKGTAIEREWRHRIKQSISNVSVHRQSVRDLPPDRRADEFNNAMQILKIAGEWRDRIQMPVRQPAIDPFSEIVEVGGRRTTAPIGPTTGGARVDPWARPGPGGAATWDVSMSRPPSGIGLDEPLTVPLPPASDPTVPGADKEPTFFSSGALWDFLNRVAGGYSHVEKSKAHGALMAQQAMGAPLQVNSLIKKEIEEDRRKKGKDIPWGWLALGAVAVAGFAVLIFAPRGRQPVVEVIPPVQTGQPTMKMLPAPA